MYDIRMNYRANSYEVSLPTMRHIGSAYAIPNVYDYATQGPNEEVGVLVQ